MEQQLWNPYRDDGQYCNPILYADYSDPDVVRVGRDYYMVASSFSNVPGLPVLHSCDLVGWQVINYALERIPYTDYDKAAHGRGVWAPSIRYHNGLFWIFFAMPDEGIFFTTAKDPSSKWSLLTQLSDAKGWIDPCPLWDDDGRAYLVHAFAKSRSGKKSLLQLFEMAPDGSALMGEGKIIFDGHNTQPTIEGPKLYKRGEYYYIFAPAGGVPRGWQTVLRARNIWGPYEEKIVMMQGESKINGPHQGGLVDTMSGEDWFIHFQDADYCGRITHLQPLQWVNSWPIIGEDLDGECWGTPVSNWKRPDVGEEIVQRAPLASDDFSGPVIGFQWQWNANPKKEWYSCAESELCLFAVPTPQQICDAPNLLLQKFPRPDFTVSAKLDFSALNEGDRFSLVMLSRTYGALAVCRTATGVTLECRMGKIGEETEATTFLAECNDLNLIFCIEVASGGLCRFFYGSKMDMLHKAGPAFIAEKGVWTGAKIGLLCSSGTNSGGSALVRNFMFEKNI